MKPYIRLATEADLTQIMTLEHESFPRDAWPEESMRFELNANHTRYFVLFEDPSETELKGYAGLSKLSDNFTADIQTIAVAPSARGKGYGRILMERLITEALEQGATEIFLEVRADNPVAENLYASLGFDHIDTRKRYYQPDDVDAKVMRLTLTASQTKQPLVLGIESSCDETGLAIYDTERGLLAHAIHTQVAMHQEYGGVVPELASRDHIRRLLPLTQEVLVGKLLGEDVARKVGPIWGIGPDGEMNNMWKRTPKPGLWFIGGSFANCRIYSRYVGLQIKAVEEGIIGWR